MIVKNEEDTIERCLLSAKEVADEIIIVDTGSHDRTKEIAARFTDKIFDFVWCDDFSAARNYAYGQAGMDYILWLDADDIILPEDAEKLRQLKESIAPDIDVVMMKYNTGFDDMGNVTFSCYRERLTKRSRNFKWKEPVHEYLEVYGKRISADICITHAKPDGRSGGRNIQIYEKFLSQGKTLSQRGTYYYARELKDHKRYADAIKWFRRFLDSGLGWVEDNIAACGELAKCYLAENDSQEGLLSMLRSFSYDNPRPETCCQIGYYFKDRKKYGQAVYWFELALKTEEVKDDWGFRLEDCRGYIPCLELAVCYDQLKNYELAAKYNDQAGEYKPGSSAVQHNKKYFEGRLFSNVPPADL